MQHYEGDVKDLSLDFTVTEESLGRRYVIELKPGGKEISVTNENKLQYIHAIADYKLNRQVWVVLLSTLSCLVLAVDLSYFHNCRYFLSRMLFIEDCPISYPLLG